MSNNEETGPSDQDADEMDYEGEQEYLDYLTAKQLQSQGLQVGLYDGTDADIDTDGAGTVGGAETDGGADTGGEDTGADAATEKKKQKKQRVRKPNKPGIGRLVITKMAPGKFEPLEPEEPRKCYGNQVGCILRECASINDDDLRSDLVSRFFSFLVNMYWDPARLEEQHMERLQQLLLRAHTVVEEADGRYITNSDMLIQLKMLARAMYQGYHVLDTFKCNQLVKESSEEVMDGSLVSYIGTPLKRFRANAGVSNHKVDSSRDLQGALLNLETAVSNITEFVILLSGCERMVRRPYDTYLYVDNFMFSRRTEKQQVINFLLQHNPLGSPPVLPIIGGSLVGKKTLVTHIWNDEKVRSYFSSVLYLNGANFTKIDTERCTSGRRLVVVTFVSDVDDEDWKSFYQAMTSIRVESKVIIISRMESLTRYGTVKPIHLSKLQHEEYSYFFKTLAFGSAQTKDHPNLTLLIGEFNKLLGGSFVGAYSIANILRRDLSLQFWLCILNRYKNVTKTNLSMFGEHLSLRVRIRYPVDFTNFLPAPAAPLLLMPPRTEAEVFEKKLPKLRIGDLVVDPTLRPKGEFDLVTWESQIPPYTEFIYHVPYCAQKQPKTTLRRKRDATICL
ncbi:hypothetical protein VPH35_057452 [Triticum aestivum]